MDVTLFENELFFLPSHTLQGETTVDEDYGWFDVPIGISADCPNNGHGLHLEDHKGLNNGHELYPSHNAGQSGPSTQIEHGLVDIP